MLIKCPECELQVSDKALNCPHCGLPMQSTRKNKSDCKTRRHRRLPNGFGQITQVKSYNLRKPYRAMITVGKTTTGKPIVKPLKPEAYFSTYNEAYNALVEYNKDPYDLDADLTMNELYEKWSEQHFRTLKTEASRNHFRISWKYCASIYDLRVKEFRIRHIKHCMENGYIVVGGNKRFATDGEKNRIKTLFNLMLDYAVEYDIVDKNYARDYKLPKEITEKKTIAETPHISFTEDEIHLLWTKLDVDYVNLILIQIYSGWRPQEFGTLKLEDIDLVNWTFTGGMKTDAGKNRIVPIHPKIRNLVNIQYQKCQEVGSDDFVYFLDGETAKKRKFTYKKYYDRFNELLAALNINADHRPHDTRKTFVTLAKKYKVDDYAIKYLIGHSISDLTERVYTDRDTDWLVSEIQKIQ